MATSTVALAQETTVGQAIQTQDYYELGTIHAVAASGDIVVVVQTVDEQVHLTYMGGYSHDVNLGAAITALADPQLALPQTLDGMSLALYDRTVVFAIGGAKLYSYSPDLGLYPTEVPTSYDMGGLGQSAITSFAFDNDGTLCAGYSLVLHRVAFARLYEAMSTVGDTMMKITRLDYQMSAQDGVLCLGYGDAYMLYDYRNDAVAAPLLPTAGYDAICYTTTPCILRNGAVVAATYENGNWQESALVASQVGEAQQDELLQNAVAICASKSGVDYRICVADNGQRAVKIYQDGALVRMLGSYGSSTSRLNAPMLVAAAQCVAVADTGNERVLVYLDDQVVSLDVSATSIACGDNAVVVAGDLFVNVYDFSRSTTQQPYSLYAYYFADTVKSVCYDGENAYALSGGVLYRLIDQSDPIKVRDLPDAIRIVAGKHRGIMYVQTPTEIASYKDGVAVGVTIEVDATMVATFDVDYCGNAYVLATDGSTLLCYERLPDRYNQSTLTLRNVVCDIAVDGQGNAYALYHHALVRLDVAVQSEQSAAFAHPTEFDLKAGTIDTQVWGYGSLNNYESIAVVPACSALHLATVVYRDAEFCYLELADAQGTRVYVPSAAFVALPDKTYSGYNVRYDGPKGTTRVYAYPSVGAQAIDTVPTEEAVFTVKRMFGWDGQQCVWPWYEVDYNGQVAYVAATYYIEDKVDYPNVQRYEARCVASRLGEAINVYAQPDYSSEIVTKLVDGTKVEMTAPLDKDSEFTCIRLSDKEVYVPTQRLKTGGLTNGQTFAILMTVVVVLAAIVTALLYALVRRKGVGAKKE